MSNRLIYIYKYSWFPQIQQTNLHKICISFSHDSPTNPVPLDKLQSIIFVFLDIWFCGFARVFLQTYRKLMPHWKFKFVDTNKMKENWNSSNYNDSSVPGHPLPELVLNSFVAQNSQEMCHESLIHHPPFSSSLYFKWTYMIN